MPLIRAMARLAAPLMTDGGTMFAMSYLGATRVVPNYNVMGPVKAALEAAIAEYPGREVTLRQRTRVLDGTEIRARNAT